MKSNYWDISFYFCSGLLYFESFHILLLLFQFSAFASNQLRLAIYQENFSYCIVCIEMFCAIYEIDMLHISWECSQRTPASSCSYIGCTFHMKMVQSLLHSTFHFCIAVFKTVFSCIKQSQAVCLILCCFSDRLA